VYEFGALRQIHTQYLFFNGLTKIVVIRIIPTLGVKNINNEDKFTCQDNFVYLYQVGRHHTMGNTLRLKQTMQ
jgi:hypothetical protein